MSRLKPEKWNEIWGSQFPDGQKLVVKHLPEEEDCCCLSVLSSELADFSLAYPIVPLESHKFPFITTEASLNITSCRGIVCFGNFQSRIVIFNPVTWYLKFLPLPHRDSRTYRAIPNSSGRYASLRMHVANGFGFDTRANDYKAIRILEYAYRYRPRGDYLRYNTGRKKTIAEVYSLKKGVWTEINCPRFVGNCLSFSMCTYVDGTGTYHWLSGYFPCFMTNFDFATDSFSTSSLPTHKDLSVGHLYELLEMESRLVAVGYNKQGMSPEGVFVFWTMEGDSWLIMKKLVVHNCLRPLLVKRQLFFFERKTEDAKVNEVVLVHASPKRVSPKKVFVKQLGFIDKWQIDKLVCFDSSTFCPPDALLMTGDYSIEAASTDDERDDEFGGADCEEEDDSDDDDGSSSTL